MEEKPGAPRARAQPLAEGPPKTNYHNSRRIAPSLNSGPRTDCNIQYRWSCAVNHNEPLLACKEKGAFPGTLQAGEHAVALFQNDNGLQKPPSVGLQATRLNLMGAGDGYVNVMCCTISSSFPRSSSCFCCKSTISLCRVASRSSCESSCFV